MNPVGWLGGNMWEWPGWMDLWSDARSHLQSWLFGEAAAQGKHIQIARRQVTGPFIAVRLGCSFWWIFGIFVVTQGLKMDQSPTFRSGSGHRQPLKPMNFSVSSWIRMWMRHLWTISCPVRMVAKPMSIGLLSPSRLLVMASSSSIPAKILILAWMIHVIRRL